MSRLSRQYGILNISQLYRPPRPVTAIALLLLTVQRGLTSGSMCIPNAKNKTKQKQTPCPVRERTIPAERPPLVVEVSANLCGQTVSRIPYGRNLGFLDWSRYFFFHIAPQGGSS
jgi:hypothetical protein